jgi:hypothetical protein
MPWPHCNAALHRAAPCCTVLRTCDGASAAQAPEAPLPEGIEPLVLWEPGAAGGDPVVVDTMLTTFLRPHQRKGVHFMFECVVGLRLPDARGACCSTVTWRSVQCCCVRVHVRGCTLLA